METTPVRNPRPGSQAPLVREKSGSKISAPLTGKIARVSRRRIQAVLPSWIRPDHVHLGPAVTKRIRSNFDPNGIPNTERSSNLEIAIVSTVTAYGLTPHTARERSNLGIRLIKIVELILTCRYGFTDLTY